MPSAMDSDNSKRMMNSGTFLVSFEEGIVAPAMDNRCSQRMIFSGVFLKLVLKQGLWFQRVDKPLKWI